MALIQTSLIWFAYAVAVALLFAIASIFVYIYQAPRDRSISVTLICIFTLGALLATVLLLPVDVALVSSTTDSKYGRKKSWATPSRVEEIEHTLKIVYYTLYSLDTILCLLVIPFTYFWYEEGEEAEADTQRQSKLERLWVALKYTVMFVLLAIILFLIGFFVPAAKQTRHSRHMDLDYFKRLLAENHGERALTFSLGLLITIGTIVYVIYTASGMALLPVALIKSAPSISVPTLVADTASQLEQNRERQRQLERRSNGRQNGLDARDRRELENLVREERTLARRERLTAEASGNNEIWLVRLWIKMCALFRPLKLIGGLLLIVVAVLIWTAMLLTGIDKAKNSICKAECGYVLGHINIFQPVNWILVKSAKVFPIDYVIFLLIVLFFFCSSVIGVATVGIRFLWVVLFKIRSGHTSPQALLIATVILTLAVLAINYSVTMIVAPQYATFGPQTYCDLAPDISGGQPDCTHSRNSVKSCSEIAENVSARRTCTPSIVSTFINRLTVNFPFFGVMDFWAQFAFLGVFFVVFITILVRTPKVDTSQIDADLEEEEEEGLLASTGRRFNATWQDITGRARNLHNYGAVEDSGNN